MNDLIRLKKDMYLPNEVIYQMLPEKALKLQTETLELYGINCNENDKSAMYEVAKNKENKYYYNDVDSIFQLDCKKKGTDENGVYSEVTLKFNPNKIMGYNHNSLEPIRYNLIEQSIEAVADKITDSGLNINPYEMFISGYHNSFDLPLKEDYSYYKPFIKDINPVNFSCFNKDSTRYIKCSRWHICIYDKAKELKRHNPESNIDKLMRIEHRIDRIANENKMKLSELNESIYYDKRIESKMKVKKYIFKPYIIRNEDIEKLEMLHQIIHASKSAPEVKTNLFRTLYQPIFRDRTIANTFGIKSRTSNNDRNPIYTLARKLQQDCNEYMIIEDTKEIMSIFEDLHSVFKKVS